MRQFMVWCSAAMIGVSMMCVNTMAEDHAANHENTADAPTASERVQVRFGAYPEDRIFAADDLELPTHVVNATDQSITCTVKTQLMQYRPNETGKVVDHAEQTLTLEPGVVASAATKFKPDAPGPYTFVITVTEAGQVVQHKQGTLLYKPAQWTLPDLEPADFDAFWKQTLQEMNKQPLEPKITEPADRRLIPKPFMEVSFNGLGDRRIHGYLGIPPQLKPGEKVPVILSLPSAGYHSAAVEPSALKKGYIFLAISIHDMPFGGESGRTHPRQYWFDEPYQGIGRQSRETFYYRAAYVTGPRAVQYLRSLPQVDPNHIIVQGLSQGGSLALATAALTPGLAMTEVRVPGRSRMDLLTFTYHANMSLDPPAGLTRQQMLDRTLLYYDVSYFAWRIRCPILMRASIDDLTNPGPLQYWAFTQITHSPDARLIMKPGCGHHTPPDPERLAETMRQKYAPAP